MKARYRSTCIACRKTINVGAEMWRRNEWSPWLHWSCHIKTESKEIEVQCKAGWTIPDESVPQGWRKTRCPNMIPLDRLTETGMCAACSDY